MSSQLQNIPKGYRQTDVGVIPDKWELCELKNIVAKFIDYRGVTPKKLGMDWGGGEICALSANNVQMGFIDFEKECYFASDKLYRRWMRNGDCEVDDILLTMEAPLGNVANIPDNKRYILSQRTILIKPQKQVKKPFLRHFMSGNYFQKSLLENATGTTAQGIQRKKLEKILVYYPVSEPEQSAITESLSDIDNLINNLEKLIEKKKAIKQGAMQELPTGKKRLPGFTGEWKRDFLINILDFTNGKPFEKYVKEKGKYDLITLDSISISGKLKNIHKKVDYYDNSLNKGDIVIILSDIAHGQFLGLSDVIPTNGQYVLNQRVGRLRVHNGFDPYFIRLKINSRQNYFYKRGQGTSQRHIYKRDINELEIEYPKFDEQNTIAMYIDEMEKEIDFMNLELDKYRQIKIGMMQQLLTGKIRLIN